MIIIVIFNKEHHFAVGYNKEEIIDYMKQHYPDYLYDGVIRVIYMMVLLEFVVVLVLV